MSKIALTPNASGTGVFTISSPATNTNRTLTLPDEAGTLVSTDASGNVGIGVTATGVKLDVLATVSDNLVARFENNHATGSYGISVKAGDDSGNYAADFANKSGTSLMRIRGDGTLLVGQTTGTIFNSSSVTGLTAAGSGSLQVAGSNSTVLYVNRQGTDGQSVGFYKAGVAVGGISVTGSATAYNTSSDYRLKTDAQPMTGASDRVLALNPVNFEWISSGDRVDGFLAHEAQAVVPECVTGTKDAMRDEEYEVTAAVLDADGMVVTEAVMGTRSVPDYQGIDQSKLVPLLTAALQEALNKIEAMETRLAALEAV